jgi:hypothetical protein
MGNHTVDCDECGVDLRGYSGHQTGCTGGHDNRNWDGLTLKDRAAVMEAKNMTPAVDVAPATIDYQKAYGKIWKAMVKIVETRVDKPSPAFRRISAIAEKALIWDPDSTFKPVPEFYEPPSVEPKLQLPAGHLHKLPLYASGEWPMVGDLISFGVRHKRMLVTSLDEEGRKFSMICSGYAYDEDSLKLMTLVARHGGESR